jgi:hypothetical protein
MDEDDVQRAGSLSPCVGCRRVISVDIRGRMGNQMFQLAFAHAAARRLGTTFILGPDELVGNFALGPWGRRPVRLARKLAFRSRYGADPADKVFVENDADPATVLAGLRDGVSYGGFFQSERYFAGHEDEVRELFQVRPSQRRAFEAVYGDARPYACVHVRRTDYIDWEGGRALPVSYFHDALALVADLEQLDVYVISDDPERVRGELGGLPGARFEVNPPMVDFQLLMHASVVVASNSSFSWWGAWLNRVPGARILAPDHWVGFPEGVEHPRDVIPPGWTRVPVRDAPVPVLSAESSSDAGGVPRQP